MVRIPALVRAGSMWETPVLVVAMKRKLVKEGSMRAATRLVCLTQIPTRLSGLITSGTGVPGDHRETLKVPERSLSAESEVQASGEARITGFLVNTSLATPPKQKFESHPRLTPHGLGNISPDSLLLSWG